MSFIQKKRLVAQWRGYYEPIKRKEPKQISHLLPDIFKKIGVSSAFDIEKISDKWKKIVGIDLAEYSKPQKIIGRTLFVQISSPTMKFIIERDYQSQIIDKISEYCSESRIKKIKALL